MRKDHYLEPYRRSQQRHGSAFEVTLWASPQSQQRRFDVFTEMCFLGGRHILDAGCSRGDFAAYLVERDIPFAAYVGVDALAEVVDFARQRRLPRCEFHVGDLVHDPAVLTRGQPDVICISGTLNTMADTEVMAVLEGAWAATRSVLMFNFLSDRCGPGAPPQDTYARRLNTLGLLEWAMGKTWCVNFRQDYFAQGHDATILMRRG